MPKVRRGRRFSATISKEYGSALDTIPTASPASSTAGARRPVPACATPNGRVTSAAQSSPIDVACPPCALPAFWPKTM